MEINYPYPNDDRQAAPFWVAAQPDMMLRDTMIPPITAPYGTPSYWPPSTNYQGLPNPVATYIGYDGQTAGIILDSFPYGEFPTVAAPTTALTGLGSFRGFGQATPTIVTPTPASDATPVAAAPACSGLSSWAGQNPLLALGGVILIFALVSKRSKSK